MTDARDRAVTALEPLFSDRGMREQVADIVLFAFLDTEGMAEKMARAMRQLEVNEGEDGWSELPQLDGEE